MTSQQAICLQVMSQNSVNLVRVFCFEDGYSLSNTPIQSSPGNWDEIGLKRIDLILSQAAAYGIYVIIVPTNFEPVGGGIQWYVNEVRELPMVPGLTRWSACAVPLPVPCHGMLACAPQDMLCPQFMPVSRSDKKAPHTPC